MAETNEMKSKVKSKMNLKTIAMLLITLSVILVAAEIVLVTPCDNQTAKNKIEELAAQSKTITINLKAPMPLVLAVGENVTYDLQISGGPAEKDLENGSYTYKAYLEGVNLTGAKPIEGSPATATAKGTGNFTLNLTAPLAVGEIKLIINATSQLGNETSSALREYKIIVVKPVIIEVEVWNFSNVTVENIAVDFYIDNKFIVRKVIPQLEAMKSVSISVNWTVPFYEPGEHIAKIVIASGDKMILFKTGTNVIYKKFLIKNPAEEGMNVTWRISIVILTVISVLIGLMLIGQRKRPQTGR